MSNISIASSAMLVELSIPQWSAKKLDKRVSNEVRITKRASTTNSGNFNKSLLPDEPTFERISTLIGAARTYHYAMTMPWLDSGPRLLTTPVFAAYQAEMSKFQTDIAEAVTAFLREYPTMVGRAAAKLGDLFNGEDYPSIDELRAKFDFRLSYSPVPDAGDFRVDVGNQALQELRQSHEDGQRARLESAYREVWDRVHKCLTNLSDKLGKENGKSRVHDSLIGNIVEMIDMLSAFNITGDPRLTQAQQALRHAITMPNGTILTPDQVREASPDTKAETKARVDALLDNMSW